MQIGYWAIPNLTSDSLPEAIPLMPAFLHHVLLKKLEAQIFRYTLGEGAQKYQAALSEYGTLVAKYQGSMGMTPGEQADYSADDDVGWTTGHAAVQSTH
jgi:predicted AlkP superfamily phosphohydrolase/phosphomutase